MISQIEISLRSWHSSGRSIHPNDFLQRLAVQAEGLALKGTGENWQAARIIGVQIATATFATDEEPSESFSRCMRQSMIDFAIWMRRIDKTKIFDIREDGFEVDVLVDVLINQNQIDFELPEEFSEELARLSLTLRLLTNS